MIGKFGISAAIGEIYIYTGELFPTVVRSFILGFCGVGARVGATLSPYIYHLVSIRVGIVSFFCIHVFLQTSTSIFCSQLLFLNLIKWVIIDLHLLSCYKLIICIYHSCPKKTVNKAFYLHSCFLWACIGKQLLKTKTWQYYFAEEYEHQSWRRLNHNTKIY